MLIDTKSEYTSFKSDKVLINRILTNLIKNALEAINENEAVTIGSKTQNNKLIFWE